MRANVRLKSAVIVCFELAHCTCVLFCTLHVNLDCVELECELIVAVKSTRSAHIRRLVRMFGLTVLN